MQRLVLAACGRRECSPPAPQRPRPSRAPCPRPRRSPGWPPTARPSRSRPPGARAIASASSPGIPFARRLVASARAAAATRRARAAGSSARRSPGTRVAWIADGGGNQHDAVLYTASLTKPAVTHRLLLATRNIDSGAGNWIGALQRRRLAARLRNLVGLRLRGAGLQALPSGRHARDDLRREALADRRPDRQEADRLGARRALPDRRRRRPDPRRPRRRDGLRAPRRGRPRHPDLPPDAQALQATLGTKKLVLAVRTPLRPAALEGAASSSSSTTLPGRSGAHAARAGPAPHGDRAALLTYPAGRGRRGLRLTGREAALRERRRDPASSTCSTRAVHVDAAGRLKD